LEGLEEDKGPNSSNNNVQNDNFSLEEKRDDSVTTASNNSSIVMLKFISIMGEFKWWERESERILGLLRLLNFGGRVLGGFRVEYSSNERFFWKTLICIFYMIKCIKSTHVYIQTKGPDEENMFLGSVFYFKRPMFYFNEINNFPFNAWKVSCILFN